MDFIYFLISQIHDPIAQKLLDHMVVQFLPPEEDDLFTDLVPQEILDEYLRISGSLYILGLDPGQVWERQIQTDAGNRKTKKTKQATRQQQPSPVQPPVLSASQQQFSSLVDELLAELVAAYGGSSFEIVAQELSHQAGIVRYYSAKYCEQRFKQLPAELKRQCTGSRDRIAQLCFTFRQHIGRDMMAMAPPKRVQHAVQTHVPYQLTDRPGLLPSDFFNHFSTDREYRENVQDVVDVELFALAEKDWVLPQPSQQARTDGEQGVEVEQPPRVKLREVVNAFGIREDPFAELLVDQGPRPAGTESRSGSAASAPVPVPEARTSSIESQIKDRKHRLNNDNRAKLKAAVKALMKQQGISQEEATLQLLPIVEREQRDKKESKKMRDKEGKKEKKSKKHKESESGATAPAAQEVEAAVPAHAEAVVSARTSPVVQQQPILSGAPSAMPSQQHRRQAAVSSAAASSATGQQQGVPQSLRASSLMEQLMFNRTCTKIMTIYPAHVDIVLKLQKANCSWEQKKQHLNEIVRKLCPLSEADKLALKSEVQEIARLLVKQETRATSPMAAQHFENTTTQAGQGHQAAPAPLQGQVLLRPQSGVPTTRPAQASFGVQHIPTAFPQAVHLQQVSGRVQPAVAPAASASNLIGQPLQQVLFLADASYHHTPPSMFNRPSGLQGLASPQVPTGVSALPISPAHPHASLTDIMTSANSHANLGLPGIIASVQRKEIEPPQTSSQQPQHIQLLLQRQAQQQQYQQLAQQYPQLLQAQSLPTQQLQLLQQQQQQQQQARPSSASSDSYSLFSNLADPNGR